ncbi:UNVERIFIED_CONTAM: hypothetical protein PYX00_000772 [Menopon gallinae]|uniref:Uncharacterized protein n=1 Tax=Menopon gallinae TaxID=328185 RepID=A0AAW2I9W9_9NEOP
MVTIIKPFSGEGRTFYEVTPTKPCFTDIIPPMRQGYKKPYEIGNRDFFLDYRKHVISKYTPGIYKWGEEYPPYVPRPRVTYSHRKQRWQEMYVKPNIKLTFKEEERIRQIEDFYLLCQFHRQYYNDYTGTTHPMDYFIKDVDRWACPPSFNTMYVKAPVCYTKYKQPLTTPLTNKDVWLEPLEPCRRMAGKREPYPDLKFPR